MKVKYKLLFSIIVVVAGLWSCASAESKSAKPEIPLAERPAVVVFEFENKSQATNQGAGTDVAQAITEALLKGKQLRPVERSELKKILVEQEMRLTGLIEESDALKVGKLIGAKYILLGSISFVADQVRLNARLIDVETSEIVKAESIFGDKKDIFKLEAELASKIEQ